MKQSYLDRLNELTFEQSKELIYLALTLLDMKEFALWLQASKTKQTKKQVAQGIFSYCQRVGHKLGYQSTIMRKRYIMAYAVQFFITKPELQKDLLWNVLWEAWVVDQKVHRKLTKAFESFVEQRNVEI